MKYPQLVSTRAVNAISDWLVSQLEQLGVESPLIYSRLLLSLLHSSVQINDDPIEFNNLESFLANRKGNRRNPPYDAITFKKLTAIQCLTETVSSDHEINKIENLVDELCEKLNDIERQINSDEEDYFVYNNIGKTITINNNITTTEQEGTEREKANKRRRNNLISNRSYKKEENITEDPTIRYYSAFPALTKEMENSFNMSSYRSKKALTWPTGNKIAASVACSMSMPINTLLIQENTKENTAGVKRKTKRRRNQAMSKGQFTNIRKSSYGGSSSSPTWDTDFEGTWEMGRDLIKEFINSQNNRNRSTSESAADVYKLPSNKDRSNFEKRMKSMNNDNENDELSDKIIMNLEFQSFLVDRKYVKKFNSNEYKLTSQQVGETDEPNLNIECIVDEIIPDEGQLTATSHRKAAIIEHNKFLPTNDSMKLCSNIEKQQQDFAQFKAKFNSSVEALWKGSNNQMNEISKATTSGHNFQSKNNNNLHNFWENYYNHYSSGNNNQLSYSSMPVNIPNLLNITTTNRLENENNESYSNTEEAQASSMIMQESIWSDNANNYDDDISFYANILKSNNKFTDKEDDIKNLNYGQENPNFLYHTSKWSEGINAVSPLETGPAANSIDRQKLRESMLKNSYFCHNLSPNLQNVQSHSASFIPSNQSTEKNYNSMLLSTADYASYNQKNSNASNHFSSFNITLKNHSNCSKFVAYSKIKHIQNDSQHQQENYRAMISASASVNADDNLLTSDKTHFRPIKHSYADGFVFDICSSLDEVNFDRSPSGYYLFDTSGECYQEFANITSDLVLFNHTQQKNLGKSSASNTNQFTLKFRINTNNEKYCQTDDIPIIQDETFANTDSKNNKNDNKKFSNLFQSETLDHDESSDESLESYFNRLENKFSVCDDDDGEFYQQQQQQQQRQKQLILKDNWSMFENGQCKKCSSTVVGSDGNNRNYHSLWGECSDNDENSNFNFKNNKSIPANRLLKDELNFEADDLIRELRMQNLYIEDEGNEENGNWDQNKTAIYFDSDTNKCFSGENCNDANLTKTTEKIDIFYNVTKLITDLLLPENATKLANAIGEASKNQHQRHLLEAKKSDNKFGDGLYHNNIWKNEFKPIDNILLQLNNNNNLLTDNMPNSNWKFSNLADLWNSTEITEDKIETKMDDEEDLIESSQTYFKKEDSNNNNNISLNISDLNQIFPLNLKTNKNDSINKVENPKRFDRKRRHSASQQQSLLNSSFNQSENFDNLQKLFDSNKNFSLVRGNHSDKKDIEEENSAPTATIINIKYWTTKLDNPSIPFILNENQWKNNEDEGITAAFINPSSILKHVVVRPLTR